MLHSCKHGCAHTESKVHFYQQKKKALHRQLIGQQDIQTLQQTIGTQTFAHIPHQQIQS